MILLKWLISKATGGRLFKDAIAPYGKDWYA
jgi:hypothetical protein